MSKNGLTMTIVFVAESANYGEGLGNISNIKKMTRGNASQYSYISRQAIRYNIVQQAEWDNTPVEDKSGVVQFAPSATIEDYPEIDLFGYMKTMAKDDNARGSASTRSAVARLSNAISLEPYLYRDLRGRRENLSPLFIIGGNYERKNPFFENIVKIDNNMINVDTLVEMKESSEDLENSTIVGVTSGIFNNDSQIKEKLGAVTIAEAFGEFKKKVDEYYA